MAHEEGHIEEPKSTIPPTPGSGASGGGSGGPNDQGQSNIYRHMYLASSGNNAGFTRLINILLDNKVYVQNIFGETGGEYAQQDIFGLGFDMAGAATNMEMIDLQTANGRGIVRRYLADKDTVAPSAITDAQIDAEIGNNRFMYKIPESMAGEGYLTDIDREGPIGLIASFDGTPYGVVNTVSEALMGMDLHRSALDTHMRMLAEASPEGFRGVQAELMMLGYYDPLLDPEGGVDVTWGQAGEIDRRAWNSFIQDLVQTSMDEADMSRSAGIRPQDWEGMTFDDFLDKRFSERMETFRQKTITPSEDPTVATYDSMKSRLQQSLTDITGSDDPAMYDALDQTLTNLIANGDIKLGETLNQDLLGFPVSDANIAKADAFGYEFFGGENWEDNIVLGVNGSSKEMDRIAKATGVDKAVKTHPVYGAQAREEDKKQMFRYLFHIIDQNIGQGDMYRTAQIFANSFGQMHMQNQGLNTGSIDSIVRKVDALEFHPAYAGSLHAANAQRLEAFDSIDKRVQSAMDLTEWDENADQRDRVMLDVLRGLGSSGQRRSRFA